MPGYAKNETGACAPTSTRCSSPASWSRRSLAEVGQALDRAAGRRRARGAPGTCRTADARRARPRCGRPPRRPALAQRARRASGSRHARPRAAAPRPRRPRLRRPARRAAGARRQRRAGASAPRRRRPAGSASRSDPAARARRRPRRRRPRRRRRRCVDVRTHAEPTPRERLDVRRRAARRTACDRSAWSPTTLTIGVRARRALCRLASPLASPGPRCSSVAAGLSGHAPVAVGRAGHDALEQAQHRAHLRHAVERGDEVHLGRAGVREADVDAAGDQRADQGLRAVHHVPLPLSRAARRGSGCPSDRRRA